jgi:hypothetical protein
VTLQGDPGLGPVITQYVQVLVCAIELGDYARQWVVAQSAGCVACFGRPARATGVSITSTRTSSAAGVIRSRTLSDEDDPTASVELDLVTHASQDPGLGQVVAAVTGTSPAREALEWLADVVRGRRARTQIKIWKKTTEALEHAGLSPHAVPDKVLVPLLEGAGLEEEDDDEMLGRWSNLLANAATAPAATAIPPAFPELLRELEPLEAMLLDRLVDFRQRSGRPNYRYIDIELGDLEGFESLEWRQLDNLERLRLIDYEVGLPINVEPPSSPESVRVKETELGRAFVKACSAPRSDEQPDHESTE